MNEKPFHFALNSNHTAALVALVGLVLTGWAFSLPQVSGRAQGRNAVHIGIEHTAPVSLSLTVSTAAEGALIDLRQDGREDIYVSVPASWVRYEVRNVPLSTVTADPPSFGFIRWRLLPGASVTFATIDLFSHLTLHNPSEIPMQLEITRVNLLTEIVAYNVILVQETPVELW